MEKSVTKEAKAARVATLPANEAGAARNKVKFEIFGEEMLEKQVKLSGASGRIYLPPEWVGHLVKIIRIA